MINQKECKKKYLPRVYGVDTTGPFATATFDVGADSETFRYLKIIIRQTIKSFFTDAGSFDSCHNIYL